MKSNQKNKYLVFKPGLTLFLILWPACLLLMGQKMERPRTKFHKDSVKIGEPVKFSLYFRYPKSQIVLFPGEGHEYGQFELLNKKYYPTQSDSVNSFDSVVYKLATFSIDSVQTLSLPVTMVNKKDSVSVFSAPDSVYFKEVIAQIPDTVQLKTNNRLLPLNYETNYPAWILIVSIILIIIIVPWLLLNNRFKRWWKLYKLRRQKKQFIKNFDHKLINYNHQPSVNTATDLLLYWKSFMESLTGKPVTSWTTSEILKTLEETEQISEPLQAIDKIIYGYFTENSLDHSFNIIKRYTIEEIEKKERTIIHGR